MQEIWKPIEGYEGQYEASNTGYIKSIERDVLRKDGKKIPQERTDFENLGGQRRLSTS